MWRREHKLPNVTPASGPEAGPGERDGVAVAGCGTGPAPGPSRRGRGNGRRTRRGTVLLMIVGLLAMLFMLVSAYIILARSDRQTLKLVSQADQVTQILGAINDLLSDAIRGNGDGDLVSGTAYVDAPGLGGVDITTGEPWGSAWLASGEPVRDATSTFYLPYNYGYPAVTALSGAPTTGRRMTELTLDSNADGTAVVVPVLPPSLPSSTDDTLANTQQAFMDADGDGIPDSHFGACAALIELANAMGGQSVRATNIDPANLKDELGNEQSYYGWQQFNETARYAVAAKVISHGGMVQVSAPTNLAQWNSQFIQQMFNWVKYPSDDPLNLNYLPAMAAESTAVEPLLRRRGGVLIGSRGNLQDGVPPALYAMQTAYGNTFNPPYVGGGKDSNWQRFNLASLTDWNLWRRATTIDPTLYLSDPIVQRNGYASRQLMTTVNNSDELARIQVPDPNDPSSVPDLYPGKLKFYLGKIASAFDATDGHFISDPTPPDLITGANYDGCEVTRELARYFEEMLQGYGDWRTAAGGEKEVVSRREQAYMLAVNTVAFAAPRSPTTLGFIDNVWCYDPTDAKMYVGYAPQPYITEVIAYNKESSVTPGSGSIALAVELFNPNERQDVGGVDQQALYLPQFALSVNDDFEGSNFDPAAGKLGVLGGAPSLPHLDGRKFLTVILNGSGNSYFETTPPFDTSPVQVVSGLGFSAGALGTMKVKLWRAGLSGPLWTLVDQFEIHNPADVPSDPTDWNGSYVDAWRDMNSELYWGRYTGGNVWEQDARWRCAVAFAPDKPTGGAEPAYHELGGTAKEDQKPHLWIDPGGNTVNRLDVYLGKPGPGDVGMFQPCVPLYTMNAGLAMTTLHGAPRPASLPTVGFMLFVPRFSHFGGFAAQWSTPLRPASLTLYEDWSVPSKNYSAGAYPADFGHMPIFENKQANNGSVGGFNKTGQVPWGLLVFDYFTTLDPKGPDGITGTFDDIDPYRVPGRININDASWYVLAGLPVIGPDPSTRDLPLVTRASPAFWDHNSGILVGFTTEDRFPQLVDSSAVASGGWYRLGSYLGQAAAAYRDRVAYVSSATVPALGDASQRNGGGALPYRPMLYGSLDNSKPDYPGGIRGANSSSARGFMTLGELANVKGFDGSTANQLLGVPPPTTLAGSTVLGGYDTGGGSVGGDFMKAVSLLALLDTHFLTTRSNTFTAYVTLTDRKNPQASVRSQMTVDRSNLLPRLVWQDNPGGVPNGIPEFPPTDIYTILQDTGPPELIGQRETSYFNARYDE